MILPQRHPEERVERHRLQKPKTPVARSGKDGDARRRFWRFLPQVKRRRQTQARGPPKFQFGNSWRPKPAERIPAILFQKGADQPVLPGLTGIAGFDLIGAP